VTATPIHIQLNNLTPSVTEKWSTFVNKHPNNTLFQSPAWFQFYQSVENYEPFVFIAYHEDNIVAVMLAVLIRESKGLMGYFSSRAIVYGGSLIAEDYPNKKQLLDQLLSKLVETISSKTIFIQFRNFFEWSKEEKDIFDRHGFVFRERINLLVDTSDEKKMLAGISKSKQRQIKTGFKNGTQVRSPESLEEVRIFFKLLVDLYKNKVRKPLPNWSFFEQFYQRSLLNELGIIRLVVLKNKIIGGVLAAVTPGRNIYELYIVGLDQQYKKNYPSIIATWTLMEYALQNNLQHFDFMGLGKPDEPYQVREFKTKFGKNIVNYGRFGRKSNSLLYLVAELGYNFLRALKKV